MALETGRTADSGGGSPSLGEILQVIRPQVEKIEEGFTAIRVTLDALAQHLGGTAGAPTGEPPAAHAVPRSSPQPMHAPAPPPTAVPHAAPTAVSTAVPIAKRASQDVPHQRGEARQAPLGSGGDWSRILFGEHGSDAGITRLSGALLADVYADDNDAVGLAGQIMTFRTAIAEHKPRLLKEIGEAFYAWRPHGEPSLIEPLIEWAHAELDAANLGNRIMVVQAGDRYDMQRHNAKQPGVEIAEVLGWVVLRDNGKVYSKANVTVR